MGGAWPDAVPLPLPPTDHVGRARLRRNRRGGPERRLWGNRANSLNTRARRVGVAGRVTGGQLRALVRSYGSRCAYCSVHLTFDRVAQPGQAKGTFDHVRPLRARGTGDVGNLVPACEPCNQERERWPDSALMVPAPHRETSDALVQLAAQQQWFLDADPLAAYELRKAQR
jgi:hypothetical protein